MDTKTRKNTKSNTLNIGERLTINQVSELRDEIIKLLSEEKKLKLDLKDVTECDTAGVQMLVSLKVYGNQHRNKISITNETETVINEAGALGFSPEDLFA